jgi:hypothetical protein
MPPVPQGQAVPPARPRGAAGLAPRPLHLQWPDEPGDDAAAAAEGVLGDPAMAAAGGERIVVDDAIDAATWGRHLPPLEPAFDPLAPVPPVPAPPRAVAAPRPLPARAVAADRAPEPPTLHSVLPDALPDVLPVAGRGRDPAPRTDAPVPSMPASRAAPPPGRIRARFTPGRPS